MDRICRRLFRHAGPARARPTAAPSGVRRRKAADAPKRRLSFNEQHALKTLPGRIETMQEEARRLEAELSDPALYGRDPDRFARAGAALEEIRAALDEAE